MTMQLRHLASALLVVSSVLPSAASAKAAGQAQTKQTNWNETFSSYELQRMASFASCVVHRDPNSVAYAIAVSTSARGADENLEQFVHDESFCLPQKGTFAFGNAVLAGDLATDMLKQQGKIAGIADALAPRAGGPQIVAHDDMEMTGICLAQKAPASAAALLSSESEAAANAALNDLAPLVAGCVPAGSTIRLSRQGLRALVAIAAYRIASKAEHS